MSNVEIIPNRRQIDNKFPVLGFTVKTGNLPFYEVIITTNKELYSPSRFTERNNTNFFSSRQTNNQLQRAETSDSVYIVPASVLNDFSKTTPKPTAIFYTVIAYSDEQGNGAQFAISPEMLAANAPAVDVAPTFTGQTLSKVLGINAESLRRVEYNGAYNSAFSGGFSFAANDEGEAEDGFSMMNANGFSPAFENLENEEFQAEDGYSLNQSYDAPPPGCYNAFVLKEHLAGVSQSYADGYEDGFEEELGYVPENYARMQESVFPAGSSEPEELYDEEFGSYREGESFSDWNDEFSFPQSNGNYESSNYELAGVSQPLSSNGLNYRTNGHSQKSYYGEDDYFTAQSNDFDEDYGEDYGEEYSQSLGGESLISKAIAGIGGAIKWVAVKAVEFIKKVAARKKIIETIGFFESGKSPYKAINADQEFAAWSWHEAYGKYHIGLSYGIVQFTQDGGSLGKLLKMMRERDKANFDKIFGGATLADELIKVTNASGSFSKDTSTGRSARVQPVDGTDIWLSPWRERFEAAGDHQPFQAAQNELANTEFLEKILQFCVWLGLDTDRAVAMVYDRAVQMGVGGAKKWAIGAVGPVSTEALQQQALTALGKKDLKDFQSSVDGLKVDGDWGPMSHAAMVSALRALGTASPIPIPTREQMMDSMVRAAAGKKWEHRVKGLRNTKDFSDTEFPF